VYEKEILQLESMITPNQQNDNNQEKVKATSSRATQSS
jgi:hypothetical protein